ncbi:hypothetical protein F5Y17DRAFT_73647 [Xylariaceae sp. FL0594]|nr:hypothetical protein F5Y17DRAFT_73647 [Xylariaceae sp. FL0594]
MQFGLSAVLLGLAAAGVSADPTQTGPFNLLITGTAKGSKIKGYGSACHAGAALEGLCYYTGPIAKDDISSQFYLNYTDNQAVGPYQSGQLFWNLPFNGDQVVAQPFYLGYSPSTNVAPAYFGFSDDYFAVGFDAKKSLFAVKYSDDSKNVPETRPAYTNPVPQYSWALCWQTTGGYYYHSIAWIQTGAPHNPTCEPVKITKA